MALRETVEGERGAGIHDLDDDGLGVSARAHGIAQLGDDAQQPIVAAVKAHGAAQLLRLGPAETRQLHREPEHLFLKQDHAIGAPQDALHPVVHVGMDAYRRLQARAPADQGIGQPARDRPGPDNRDRDRHIVKRPWLQPRQRRHLCA